MAHKITEVHNPETLTRNRRTRGLKKFVEVTKHNVHADPPAVAPTYREVAALELEAKRSAQIANRQVGGDPAIA